MVHGEQQRRTRDNAQQPRPDRADIFELEVVELGHVVIVDEKQRRLTDNPSVTAGHWETVTDDSSGSGADSCEEFTESMSPPSSIRPVGTAIVFGPVRGLR